MRSAECSLRSTLTPGPSGQVGPRSVLKRAAVTAPSSRSSGWWTSLVAGVLLDVDARRERDSRVIEAGCLIGAACHRGKAQLKDDRVGRRPVRMLTITATPA